MLIMCLSIGLIIALSIAIHYIVAHMPYTGDGMIFQKKKEPSKNIEKFVDQLYQFEKEHPDELCPMETDPQLVVDCLIDVFLGVDWYTPMPVNTKQVNTIILDKILHDWSKEFRILVNKKKKQWKEER